VTQIPVNLWLHSQLYLQLQLPSNLCVWRQYIIWYGLFW